VTNTKKQTVSVDRRNPQDRREIEDRRKQDVPVGEERRTTARRKVQRRRQIDPTTCERDYTEVEIEFMHALDAYKRANGRMFPTCSEILEVIRDLGYVKVVQEQESARTEPASGADTIVADTVVVPSIDGIDGPSNDVPAPTE